MGTGKQINYLKNIEWRKEMRFHIYLGKVLCHAHVHIGGEERDIMVTLAIPWLFAVYFSIMGLLPRRWTPGHWAESQSHPGERFWYPVKRRVGISIHDGGIWFSGWENEMEWNRDDPWWWHFVIFPLDILLGRAVSRSEEYDTGGVGISLPEGMYLAKYVLSRRIVKRPRWPWARVYLRGEIAPEIPIPIPGRGENSWDLDDDAVFNFDCLAADARELVEKLEASVLRTRVRYGGPEWQASLTQAWSGKGKTNAEPPGVIEIAKLEEIDLVYDIKNIHRDYEDALSRYESDEAEVLDG